MVQGAHTAHVLGSVAASYVPRVSRPDNLGPEHYVQGSMVNRHALASSTAPELTDITPGSIPDDSNTPAPKPAGVTRIEPTFAGELIERVFIAGLHLAALQCLMEPGEESGKLVAAIDELDLLIRDIRAGVFVEPTGLPACGNRH
jgi:hypothetical protein